MRAVALLLKNGADVNARNSEGETAMVVIAKSISRFSGSVWSKNAMSIMLQLLEKGASTTATDRVLDRTSLEGHHGLVRLLLQWESISVTQRNVMILTKLYNAIWEEDDRAINQLLHEKEILESERILELLLVYRPAQRGYEDVVLTFLQSGAAIEAKTLHGESALHVAAERGHLKTVELLLHHGADISSKTTPGDTPLVCAARGGSVATVELLLEQGAHINSPLGESNKNTTAIIQALYGGSINIVEMLLKRGADVNFRDVKADGGTLLHLAARNPHEMSQERNIKLLLKYGAAMEGKDDEGRTPLAAAVEDYTLEAMPILLERGANLEARDYNGETPLGAAVRKGILKAVHVLLEKGADLEARNNKGHTPLVMAVRLGNIKMVQYLLEQGADPQAVSPDVTIEDENVYDYDFERAVKIVLEAQSKTRS